MDTTTPRTRALRRAISHLRGHAVGYLALTVALGGTSYAATALPRDSVGQRQIQAAAVGPAELRTLPAVRVDDDTQVSIPTAGFEQLSLDDEVFDTARMHPGAGRDDRIEIKRSGTYVLAGEVAWEPNGGGFRALDLVRIARPLPEVLGSSRVEPRDSAIQQTVQQVTAIVRLEAGEKVSLLAGQGSGGDLEMQRASLSAAFAGP